MRVVPPVTCRVGVEITLYIDRIFSGDGQTAIDHCSAGGAGQVPVCNKLPLTIFMARRKKNVGFSRASLA